MARSLLHSHCYTLSSCVTCPPSLRLQVALNWIICKGALPIPGAKTRRQVEEIAGAVGWRLDDGEVVELEKAANRVETPMGAPFENW